MMGTPSLSQSVDPSEGFAPEKDCPLISVIVPIFRVEQYLRDCIQSIREQTYRNLEIILVNDGSPDQCGAICQEFAHLDDRIKVIHKPNGGLSSARNSGLDSAIGDFIGFVDADDLIAPNMYATLISLQHTNGADLVNCAFVRFSDNAQLPAATPESFSPQTVYVGVTECLDAFIRMKINPAAWNKLYRRAVISDLRFPSGKTHEDEFFTPGYLLRATRVATTTQPLYYYRARPGSIMRTAYNLNRLDALEAFQYQLSLLREHAVQQRTIDVFVRRYRLAIEEHHWNLVKNPPLDPDHAIRKKLQQELRSLPLTKSNNWKGDVANVIGSINLHLLNILRSPYA